MKRAIMLVLGFLMASLIACFGVLLWRVLA